MLPDHIRRRANELYADVLKIRRHIHAHPELSFHEFNTVSFVEEQLRGIGITDIKRIAGTGLMAHIQGREPASTCIALRADMDALPITEENDVPYVSQNKGVMHACGHDVHTSCLLGAARILHEMRDQFTGTIKLLFQPGEESHPGGASIMIEEGALKDPVPQAIFGLHVFPNLPAGTVGFRPGRYMASADEIYITIHGKGGHAAQPHQTVDPISIAALIITGLQQVIARKCDPMSPSVLTFGKIAGGFATNVIPEKVELLGTFRAMDEKWRYEAHKWIRDFTEQTCAAYGATATVDIPIGYPVLFNDPALTEKATNWATQYAGGDNVHPLEMRMGAEDFAFYTHHVPGCFFRIGTNRNNTEYTAPVHNPRFNVDEEALKTGMGMMAWLALNAIAE
ncbi:MAG: amidohydrolase [Flavipsychrobacter sp.]|nr:amidohydrolase [Flavipsychrobacter sp.]